MTAADDSPLGKASAYAAHYDPTRLFAISRGPNRAQLGIDGQLPFVGVDVWNAYELSWLDRKGKPQVALAEFRVPAESPNIIESKSFKLYLNGYCGERLAREDVIGRMRADLSAAAGAGVDVGLVNVQDFARQGLQELDGVCIDTLDIVVDHYGPPRADYLNAASRGTPAAETLVSHLLKSNCPVTGQPDWASVQITYAGPTIDHAGLLRYLISFREHADFHEHCVERIFMDIRQRCSPDSLSVYARYTRRGGLDINPWRSTHQPAPASNPRGARQ